MKYEVTITKEKTEWRHNGQLHREDGPAVVDTDGTKEWWIKGEQLTEEEHNKETKRVIIIDGVKYIRAD